MISDVLKAARKIVIKVGTNTLSDGDGRVDESFFDNFAEQVSYLRQEGKQVILVSSGARITGVSLLNRWHRKEDMHYKQALCAIGQVVLMDSYRRSLAERGLIIGQVLLTRDDFTDHMRTLHVRNTLFTLVDEGVIPVINENDSVSIDEIRIGDNDTLAALTAKLWNADLMILLSDIDGVYDKNPKHHPDATLLEEIRRDLTKEIAHDPAGDFGTGGIRTKLEAARAVNEFGIPMILANGKRSQVIPNLLLGKGKASVFLPPQGE